MTIEALESNKRKRWLVERGLEIISEASRRLPEAMKTNHPIIPWPKIAGIGNILRHEYEHLAHDVLWRLATNDLPIFETVCRNELSAEQSRITLRDGGAS